MSVQGIMSIAAGLAIGYFIYQFMTSKSNGTERGRLHKSSTEKKICGVCGGLAEYLGCDPTLMRIAWAVLVCGWGSGVVLYFILAFVLPEE